MMQSDSLQFIKVSVQNSNGITAHLECFERANFNEEWKSTGLSFPVVIGKNGLAAEGEKREGDGKTPTGTFALVSSFGYADKANAGWIKLPYIQCTPSLRCVDDVDSRFYNKIVDENEAAKDWNSAEEMLRKDDLYKWGIIVGYNTDKPVPGLGSAIFMHLWLSANEGTEGCLAMEEGNMVKLLKWLQIDQKPRIQILS